jgi:hypothetical protein
MPDPAVHAAVARRGDPEHWESCGPEPGEVAGLRIELHPEPRGIYRVEVTAALLVLGDDGEGFALAPFLEAGDRRVWAPWRDFAPPDGMVFVEHAFAGVRFTGEPIAFALAIRTTGAALRYSSGHLSALAMLENPLTVQPGLGLTLRLA